MMKINLAQGFSDLKNEWERTTDKKILLNNVRQEVGNRLKAQEFSIEERRERHVIR